MKTFTILMIVMTITGCQTTKPVDKPAVVVSMIEQLKSGQQEVIAWGLCKLPDQKEKASWVAWHNPTYDKVCIFVDSRLSDETKNQIRDHSGIDTSFVNITDFFRQVTSNGSTVRIKAPVGTIIETTIDPKKLDLLLVWMPSQWAREGK